METMLERLERVTTDALLWVLAGGPPREPPEK